VFAPRAASAPLVDPEVCVRDLPDRFGPRSLAQLSNEVGDARILVQYVPHAFGMRAMNLPFCLWLNARSSRNEIWTMFHEVAFPFDGQPLRRQVIALANRAMAALVAGASQRIFVSIPGWTPMLENLGVDGMRIIESPIPSNLPVRVRAGKGKGEEIVIGHFGTFGGWITPILDRIVPELLHHPRRRMVLVGKGSCEYRAKSCAIHPMLEGVVSATGAICADDAARQLASCDVLLQVYPDGISGRRGSAVAGLALGVPMVSNLGWLSESFWQESHAVALASSPDPAQILAMAEAVLADASRRQKLAARARQLYAERFDIERTIDRLISVPAVNE
jgi:glycosyltransferase involved in cell wall biosynthesis